MSSVARRIARQRSANYIKFGMKVGDWPERHSESFARSKKPRWDFQNGSSIEWSGHDAGSDFALRLARAIAANPTGAAGVLSALTRDPLCEALSEAFSSPHHEPECEPTGDASPSGAPPRP